MPMYRADINGRNFLLELDGKLQRCGFYQTVFVEAADPAQAEATAIGLVKASPDLKGVVKNELADPPMLFLSCISEVASSNVSESPSHGRTFYIEGT